MFVSKNLVYGCNIKSWVVAFDIFRNCRVLFISAFRCLWVLVFCLMWSFRLLCMQLTWLGRKDGLVCGLNQIQFMLFICSGLACLFCFLAFGLDNWSHCMYIMDSMDFHVSHIYREDNACVDQLAREALTLSAPWWCFLCSFFFFWLWPQVFEVLYLNLIFSSSFLFLSNVLY